MQTTIRRNETGGKSTREWPFHELVSHAWVANWSGDRDHRPSRSLCACSTMKFIGTNEPRFDSSDLNDRVSFNRSNEPEFDKKISVFYFPSFFLPPLSFPFFNSQKLAWKRKGMNFSLLLFYTDFEIFHLLLKFWIMEELLLRRVHKGINSILLKEILKRCSYERD